MKTIRFFALFATLSALLVSLSAAAQHNGTIVGSPTFGSVKFGSGLTAVSDTNYVSMPAGIVPAGTNQVTFECSGSLPTSATTRLGVLCDWAGATGDVWIGANNGNLSVNLPDNANAGTSIGTHLIADGGNHTFEISCSTGSSTNCSIFEDGQAIGTGTYTAGALGSYTSGFIGRYNAAGYSWQGAVGYAATWSTNRHTATYTPTTTAYTGTEAGLMSLYKLAGNASDSFSTGSQASPITVNPTVFPLGVVTPLTITTSGAAFAAGTYPTLTGSSDAFFSNRVVNGQTISVSLWPGSTAGAVTIGETADAATASATVSANTNSVVVFHGTSLSAGSYGSNSGTVTATHIQTVLNGMGPGTTAYNQGVPGQTLVQMLSQVSSIANLYQAGKSNFIVADGCTNDIAAGADATTCLSRWKAYLAAVHAAQPGFKVIMRTITPAGGSTYSYPSNFDVIRDASNALLRANAVSMGVCKVADVARDARIGQDGQEYNTQNYSADAVHPVDAGYGIIGQVELAAIQAAANGCDSASTTLAY